MAWPVQGRSFLKGEQPKRGEIASPWGDRRPEVADSDRRPFHPGAFGYRSDYTVRPQAFECGWKMTADDWKPFHEEIERQRSEEAHVQPGKVSIEEASAEVLAVIRRRGECKKWQIEAETRLSGELVGQIVNALAHRGVLEFDLWSAGKRTNYRLASNVVPITRAG